MKTYPLSWLREFNENLPKSQLNKLELNKLFISMKALIALQNIHTKFEQNPGWTVETRHRIVDEKKDTNSLLD